MTTKTPRALLAALFLLLSLAHPALADEHIWRPNQPALLGQYYIAVTGVWDADDDCSVATPNGKTASLTAIGTTVTTASVAAKLAALLNASDLTTDLVEDETRNVGPQIYGEFNDITATAGTFGGNDAVLITGTVPGRPFTFFTSENTTSTGELSDLTAIIATNGPNHYNAAANWHNSTLPTAGDTIIFNEGEVDCLYGLDVTGTHLNLIRTNGYKGQIGLRATNTDWTGKNYPEYRTRLLYLQPGTAAQTATIGDLTSPFAPTGQTFLDFGTGGSYSVTLTVYNAAAASTVYGEAVQVVGGEDVIATIHAGSVRLGAEDDEDEVELKALTLKTSTADVKVNDNVILDAAYTGTTQENGTLLFQPKTGGDNADHHNYGGTATLAAADAFGEIVAEGGTVKLYQSSTTLIGYPGGVSTFAAPATITNGILHRGTTVNNQQNHATWSNGFSIPGGSINDIIYNGPDGQTWTPSGP